MKEKELKIADAWPPIISQEQQRASVSSFVKLISSSSIAEGICVVCAERVVIKDMTTMSVSSVKSKLPAFTTKLKPNPAMNPIPDMINSLHYSIDGHHLDDLKGLLLCQDGISFDREPTDSKSKSGADDEPHTSLHAGLGDIDGDNHERTREPLLRICNNCFRQLKDGKLPEQAIANDHWHGTVPSCISSLTFPERLLISPYRLCIWLHQLRGIQGVHIPAYKGNTYAYPQDVGKIYTSLPVPIQDVAESLSIQFVGITPKPSMLKKVYSVNRLKVETAIRWLREHNEHYRDITINEAALSQLPTDADTIPPELYNSMTVSRADPYGLESDGYVDQELKHSTVWNDGNTSDGAHDRKEHETKDENDVPLNDDNVEMHGVVAVDTRAHGDNDELLQAGIEQQFNIASSSQRILATSCHGVSDTMNMETILKLGSIESRK